MQLQEYVMYILLAVCLGKADHEDDHYRDDVTTTIGNAPTSRVLVGASLPGQHGVVIPQPLVAISRTAILTNWTVYLRGTHGKVRLQIWRPKSVSSGNDDLLFYTLIGQTDFKDVASVGDGMQTFTVWPQNKIRLAPNDTFGLEFVDANPVTYDIAVPCKYNSSSVMWTRSLRSETGVSRDRFFPGREYEFSRMRPPECRMYSLQLQLQTNECKRLRASSSGQVEQIYRPQREDADVCWLLAPSDASHVVRLQVLQERSLDTILVNNCSFVTMEIRIGIPAITSNLVYSHCDIGYHEIPFDASNKEIYIRLVTSLSVDYPQQLAISMAFSSKALQRQCEKVSTDENPAYIQSPGFPNAYPRNKDICWFVSVSEPFRVRIEVQQSELEASYSFTSDSDGCVDYVEIFDGSSEISPRLARWCGLTDPGMLTASGSIVLIRFYSGPYTVYPGFRLAFWAASEADSTTCTKLEASADEQFLYSPGYPHAYRVNENTCWEIHADPGHRLQIQVYDSSLEGDNMMCEYDVVIIRDGSHSDSPVLRRWCGTMRPREPVVTSDNVAHISLYSDGSISNQGFYLGFTQVMTDECIVYGVYPYVLDLSAFQLLKRTPSTECFTLETELPGYNVRLELMSLLKSNNCDDNYIEVYDGPSPDGPLLARWCGDVTANYVTSTKTSLHVRIVITTMSLQDADFKFSYLGLLEGNCRRVDVGLTEGYLNSPTADMNPFHTRTRGTPPPVTPYGRRPVTDRPDPAKVRYAPNADECTILETEIEGAVLVLRIVFVQLEQPDASGTCTKDYLEIRDGNTERSPVLVKQCGQHSSYTLVTSGRFAYVRFVSNGENQYRGFQIRFAANSTTEAGCTLVNVTQNGGVLTSPGYPNPYPSMTDLCWILTTPNSQQIDLTIAEFVAEDGCLDYLEIYDGKSADNSLLTLVCGGGKAPQTVTSSGSALYIRFYSDSGIQYRGFRINYRTASTGICKHIAVGDSVTSVTSPNWPMPPPRSAEFCWVLTTPGHAEHIVISVSESDMLDSLNCEQDFVQVSDGPMSTSPPILRWCGDRLPPDMTTSGRSAFLQLVTSSGNMTSKGFVINFRSLSPPVIAASTGGVLSGHLHWVIIAAIAGIVLLGTVIAVLCFLHKRRKQSPPTMSPSNGNAIYDIPSMVHSAHGDSTQPNVGPMDSKNVRLNLDGSASFSTAFENPGYSELPPS